MRIVDLNADLGEVSSARGAELDQALLEIVTSANVACGGHAGDADSMRRVCDAATAASVAIGAQVSYVDREGFGRRALSVSPSLLADQLHEQITALEEAARLSGGRVAYLKPHGALYHAAAKQPEVAHAVVSVAVDASLPVLTQPLGHLHSQARDAGLPVFGEAFADRAYEPTGHLVSREHPDAVVSDPTAVVSRVVEWAATGLVRTRTGELIEIDAISMCLHGDTPGAVDLARSARRALEKAGVPVRPFIEKP